VGKKGEEENQGQGVGGKAIDEGEIYKRKCKAMGMRVEGREGR
jgi:hypothetical protein